MKRVIFICCCLLIATIGIAQDITGKWQGFIKMGDNSIRFIMNLSKNGETYTASFDSPDQHAFGIGANKTSVVNDSVNADILVMHAGYSGKWNGKDQITGIFRQGNMTINLDMKRLSNEEMPNPPITKPKPQTPTGPFNYISEDVIYENSLQQVTLGATLTKPKGDGKFPVVIMITGSGAQDRDETIGMHKPFFVIADYLTNHGIAVLRVDDRGVGKSTGDFKSSTSADFATDVMAGINYLKTRNDIDTSKIGLMGHSEGGLIAPYVAARRKDVAFIVLLAGPAVGGKKTLYYQAVEKPLAKISEHDRNAYGQFYNAMIEIGISDEVAKNIPDYVRTTYLDWKKQQPDSTLKVLVPGSDEEVIKGMVAGFSVFNRAWFRFFLTYDISKDLQKIKIPLLALNGGNDEQVDPKENLALIKQILTKNKNPNFKVYEVPGVNHLFQHCKACGSVSEYLALDETFDPATLALISSWINEQVK
jgi:pimeloyl-ACP methyl ester carboxylesterase